jgi:hypothetical protein
MAAQFSDDFTGGHGVVFNGQDAGHGAGLIKCSQRCAAFCQEMFAGFLNKSSWSLQCIKPAESAHSLHIARIREVQTLYLAENKRIIQIARLARCLQLLLREL